MRPRLSYVLSGDGPAVLLLHGLGGDHNQSLGLVSETVQATRIAPDLSDTLEHVLGKFTRPRPEDH